ncbi:MAG: ATP phosphoribosyltransferase [Kangiellaceae bacterium]|jgi:ATP phosphoribosyltransferase|nr:ATP phosphoribosyltransferase [Kangiellaceae bacterium]|tara:strand:- start:9998 stop:10636 length:639 start_codon:yes stop_codon:yes gene_type:complete
MNIRIALSKGRILEETLPLLKAAGIELLDDPDKSRKLILETSQKNVDIVILRATDVPTYVDYGAADFGVAGKDVLLEYGSSRLYEPLDLEISKCKLMVAGFPDAGETTPGMRIRVATKFVNIAKAYFAQKGVQAEVVKLYGSMELAPIVELADRIVDIVDTGNTLRANGLVPLEHIADISSRLVVNQASMKTKFAYLQPVIEQIRQAVKDAN